MTHVGTRTLYGDPEYGLAVDVVHGDLVTRAAPVPIADTSPELALALTYDSARARARGRFGAGWAADVGLDPKRWGAQERCALEGRDLPRTFTDHFGRRLNFEYQRSQLSGIVAPTGTVTRLSGDSASGAVEVVDPAGTRYRYECRGGLLVGFAAPQGVTSFDYDGDGRLMRVERSPGSGEEAEYGTDGRVRLVRGLGAGGSRTSFDYASGETIVRVDDGAPTTYRHDASGRVVSQYGAVPESDLWAIEERLSEQMGRPGSTIVSVGGNDDEPVVDVGVLDPACAEARALRARYGDAVNVYREDPGVLL